jgi:hypothetical protein
MTECSLHCLALLRGFLPVLTLWTWSAPTETTSRSSNRYRQVFARLLFHCYLAFWTLQAQKSIRIVLIALSRATFRSQGWGSQIMANGEFQQIERWTQTLGWNAKETWKCRWWLLGWDLSTDYTWLSSLGIECWLWLKQMVKGPSTLCGLLQIFWGLQCIPKTNLLFAENSRLGSWRCSIQQVAIQLAFALSNCLF